MLPFGLNYGDIVAEWSIFCPGLVILPTFFLSTICFFVARRGWLELLLRFIWGSKFFFPSWKYGCLNIYSLLPFTFDLWKSYILSWRIKDEKLSCLKYWGSILSLNYLGCLMTKPSPSLVHVTISWVRGLLTISNSFTRNEGTWYID